ncbi:MAG: SNF2-related protein, partial [Candidatus Poribacteria bacterium]|nr:SNF2-related protein [Candidatus Poribacteria bacterium]
LKNLDKHCFTVTFEKYQLNLFRQSETKTSQFNWDETSTGIQFTIPSDNVTLTEYTVNLPPDAYQAQAQWLLLKELLDNGQAEALETGVRIPFEEICRLESVEQELLGLPEPYPFEIEIRSDGTFNQPEFRYNYQFLKPDWKPLHPTRTGCILRLTEEWAYLLTHEQFTLLKELDSFNTRDTTDKSFEANLIEFAKIKGLAKETGSALEDYLNQEEVVAPKTIRLRLCESGDSVEIIPDVADINNEQFKEVFDKFPNSETTYNLSQPDGGRTRVLFEEKQKEALQTLKQYRRVPREKLAEIAEQPQLYFDPEVIELDPTDETLSFSGRVREIGIYQPRVYPFVSPYKSEWVPGILVEDEVGTRTKLQIKTEEELTNLKQTIHEAKRTGQKRIKWKGQKLPVSDIERHLSFIEEQLKHRKKPSRSQTEKSEITVLIIEENIEDPNYVEETSSSEVEEPFRHLLEPTPNLKQGVKLLPHQEEGLAWAQQLWENSYLGGLLADDMGLGKTLQVLCFLEWHHANHRLQESQQRPYLIVAPIALLENWAAEYPKFFDNGSLEFITLYGKALQNFKCDPSEVINQQIPDIEGAERLLELRKRRGALDVKRLRDADVVLTTYETVRDFQLDLGLIPWATVVIDEAQRIKTPGALVTNALKALKTDFRLAMTGTPVENSLMDLWCIADFVAPGYLESAKKFNSEFCRPLKNPETDIRALGDQIRERIGIYLKRRLKTDILDDLPEKHIHHEGCRQDMPPIQAERYQAALKSTKDSESDGPQQRNRILQVLHQLRDISDHPLLADSQWKQIPVTELIKQSAKLMVTVQLLKKIRSANEKVILFAERRKTQHLLAHVVREQFDLKDVCIVNGDTPGSTQRVNSMKMSRQQSVDRFQNASGFNTIIMSPLSAGVGLNITEANHVIHYSRWWNPAKEDQASDRVYRIGQKRPVHIYLPMATHPQFQTFDVILHELLERKRQLSQGTLFPTEQAEVTPKEILEKLQPILLDNEENSPLTIEDVDKLEPRFFEAFVAALFDKQGYYVVLTPYSGDKGADVIARQRGNETEGFLIQAKHRQQAGGKADRHGVDEILAAKPFYEEKYEATFQLAVITNREFNKPARQYSRSQQVEMYERKQLIENLKQYPVTWQDVNKCQFYTN